MLIETFVIHARNLLCFLYPSEFSRESSDVTIYDYLSPQEINDLLSEEPEFSKWVKEKANKQVMHIAKERLIFEINGKEWSPIMIANEIKKYFVTIAKSIPEEKIKPDINNFFEEPSLKLWNIVVESQNKGLFFNIKAVMKSNP